VVGFLSKSKCSWAVAPAVSRPGGRPGRRAARGGRQLRRRRQADRCRV